jgi:hypothetical protein
MDTSYLSFDEVDEFISDYFLSAGPTLLIGNVGFSSDVLYFPSKIGPLPQVDVRFLSEVRPDVPEAIIQLAAQRGNAIQVIAANPVEICDIAILADDGAPVGGRNACAQVHAWMMRKTYTDVVVDATGMSRGTAFPIVKQLYQISQQQQLCVHLLFAESESQSVQLRSVSNDRADWMHGFPAASETDEFVNALKLWVVQLSENSGASLQAMFKQLETPDEVCPVLPFPSTDPRRADQLLFELREHWREEWVETPMSFIRAHESDPIDVYRSISRLHEARSEALLGSGVPAVTILSPVGRRLPGIGMLLAALSYDLPILYMETIGYDLHGDLSPTNPSVPTYRWHFRVDQLKQSPAK